VDRALVSGNPRPFPTIAHANYQLNYQDRKQQNINKYQQIGYQSARLSTGKIMKHAATVDLQLAKQRRGVWFMGFGAVRYSPKSPFYERPVKIYDIDKFLNHPIRASRSARTQKILHWSQVYKNENENKHR
jgi:hypothetical protein